MFPPGSNNVGAAVGGAIGGIAVVALIVLIVIVIVLLFLRKGIHKSLYVREQRLWKRKIEGGREGGGRLSE